MWGGPVHRGDFRRKVLSVADFLAPTGDVDTATGGPPADLYRLGGNTQFHPPMLRDSMLLAKQLTRPDRSMQFGTGGVVLVSSSLRHWNRDRGKNHVELA